MPIASATPVAQTPNQIAQNNPNIVNNAGNTPVKTTPTPITPTAPTTTSTPPASTTTVSNTNKIAAVPGIQQTTAQLSGPKGISLNASGTPTYANGTMVAQTPNEIAGGQSNQNNNPSSTSNTTTPVPSNTYTDALGKLQPVGPGTPPAGSTPDGNGNYLTPDGQTVPAPSTDSSYQFSQMFSQINTLKGQVSAQLATTLDNIQNQYAQLIQQQTTVNAGAQASIQNSLIMAGVATSPSSASTLQQNLSYGLQKIQTLNTQMNTAIQNAQNAALTEDIQLQDQYNTIALKITDQQQAVATKIQEDLATAQEQNAKDVAVANLFTQGTTNPADILKALNATGNTDISLKDITDAIATIVPPEITTMLDTALKNGLTDPATIKALAGATSITQAAQIGAKYLQTATGPLGDYLEYQRQGGVATYEEWTTNQANQKTQEAVSQADQIENNKIAIDQSAGVLDSAQQQAYKDATAGMATDKTIVGFKNVQSQYTVLQDAIKNNDPASESAALAAFIQMAVPNTSSLRGSAAVLDSMFGTTLSKAAITVIKTGGDIGTLSNADRASIQKAATNLYNDQLENYQNVRQDYVDAAETAVPGSGKLVPNFDNTQNSIQTQKTQDATDIAAISSFRNSSPANKKIADDLHTKFPGASPGQIKQMLGIQ